MEERIGDASPGADGENCVGIGGAEEAPCAPAIIGGGAPGSHEGDSCAGGAEYGGAGCG